MNSSNVISKTGHLLSSIRLTIHALKWCLTCMNTFMIDQSGFVTRSIRTIFKRTLVWSLIRVRVHVQTKLRWIWSGKTTTRDGTAKWALTSMIFTMIYRITIDFRDKVTTWIETAERSSAEVLESMITHLLRISTLETTWLVTAFKHDFTWWIYHRISLLGLLAYRAGFTFTFSLFHFFFCRCRILWFWIRLSINLFSFTWRVLNYQLSYPSNHTSWRNDNSAFEGIRVINGRRCIDNTICIQIMRCYEWTSGSRNTLNKLGWRHT